MSSYPEILFGFNRRISSRWVPYLLKTPITPNQITTLSLACGMIAAFFLSHGLRPWLLAGAAFWQLAFILDNCDGAVARQKGLSSVSGMWYDFVADLLVDFSIWTGLGWAVYHHGGASYALWTALAAAAGSLINFVLVAVRRTGGKTGKEAPPDPKNIFHTTLHVLSNDGDPTLLIWIFALIGRPEYFLVLGCFYINFIWIAGVFTASKNKL